MMKKSRSIKYDAWGLWWVILFVIFMLITSISPSLFGASYNFFIRVTISAILASILNIVMFKFVFPNMIKNQKAFNEIMNELRDNGMSEQLNDRMIEQYNICSKNPAEYYVYILNYAILISAYYADVYEDYATAYEYLDKIDFSAFSGYLRYSEVKAIMVQYYTVKLEIECDANDKVRADNTYKALMEFCELYEYKDELNSLKTSELVFCSYNILCGNCQDVINKLEQTNYDEYCTVTKLTILAKAYTKLGDVPKALEMWGEALNCTKQEIIKKIIQREMNRLAASSESIR